MESECLYHVITILVSEMEMGMEYHKLHHKLHHKLQLLHAKKPLGLQMLEGQRAMRNQ